jgi:hypothetical protein
MEYDYYLCQILAKNIFGLKVLVKFPSTKFHLQWKPSCSWRKEGRTGMRKLLIPFSTCFSAVFNTSKFSCSDYEVWWNCTVLPFTLTLALEESDCSASRPASFPPKKQPRYPLNRVLDEPPDTSGQYTEHKHLLPVPRIEARILSQLVCYFSSTNYAPWAQRTL